MPTLITPAFPRSLFEQVSVFAWVRFARARPPLLGQSSTSVNKTDLCNNLIGLAGDLGYVTLPGGISPVDGGWGGGKQMPFEFEMSQVGSLSAELRITAGTCIGTGDLDDFEINRIRVYFR